MPFIRKHRLMLVPLFVVAVLGAGLVFLLRSQSEEPAGDGESGGSQELGGNVSSAYPRETAAEWQEDVSKRFQHGREYRVARTVERIDPETKEVVTDTIVSTVRERGTNICCKDEAGEWVPTIAEWEEGGLGFRMKRNSWQIEVPLRLGNACEYTVGGRTLAMRPGALVLSDGTNTVSLGTIDTTVQGWIDPDDPSRLVFADVLGENSGVDIEFVLECAALHQNVVLRKKPSLPEGFDEENARLYVYTELGLDAFTADGAVGVAVGETPVDVSSGTLATARNEHDPITFTARETVDGQECETVLHWFAESRVWDSTGAASETCAARQLWRDPRSLKTYLVESVPFSFLADAAGAVTLDYHEINASITSDETWTADETYYVSSNITISGTAQDTATLTIEPGTVVKLNTAKSITVGQHGEIVAKGEPLRCIVFTSKNDDASGETIPGSSGSPVAGNYGTAINIGSSASPDCKIEYSKIAYATYGIQVTSKDFGTIGHCIIRTCSSYGIYITGTAAPDVFNCLISDCSTGVNCLLNNNGPNFQLVNNTLDDCSSNGILLYTTVIKPPLPNPTVTIHNSLITHCGYGIAKIPSSAWGTFTLSYDAYYGNTTNLGYITDSHPIYLTLSPFNHEGGYNDSPLGDYFIDTTDVWGYIDGSDLVNAGYDYANTWYGDGGDFCITAPDEVSGTQSGTTWSKIGTTQGYPGDSGYVDIGYHHPRVDKVTTGGTVEITSGTLEIDEGVVAAFDDSSPLLIDDSDVVLTCNGTAADPIRLVGGALASMDIKTPDYDPENEEYRLLEIDDADEISITHTDFLGAGEFALVLGRDCTDSTHVVEHCTFALSTSGVLVQECNADLTNLLFDLCWEFGISADFSGGGYGLDVHNATVSRTGTGIGLAGNGDQYAALTVKDCLFTECDTAQNYEVEFHEDATVAVDFNAYWECDHLILADGDIVVIGPNSMVLSESPYDDGWGEDWGKRWYLVQNATSTTPCVNAGSRSVADADLTFFTTKLSANTYFDVGTVDIGYHYDPGYADAAGISEITITNVYCGGNDLDIYIDIDASGDWKVEIFEATTMALVWSTTDDSYPIHVPWDGTGATGDGMYIVRISSLEAPAEFDPFSFCIYRDTGPPNVTILSPESGTTVNGC